MTDPQIPTDADPSPVSGTSSGNDGSTNSGSTNRGSSLFWWISCLVIGLLLAALIVLPRRPDAGPAVGKPAPPISLVALGESTPPLSDSIGRPSTVTLLHFWGTWCGPCRQEYPELVSMVQRLESSHPSFQFVSVSCEPPVGNNTLETLRDTTYGYYAEIGVDVPTYCDPRGYSRASAAKVLERPAMYYPTTILIGPDGKVSAVWEGYSRSGVEQMSDAIKRLLAAT